MRIIRLSVSFVALMMFTGFAYAQNVQFTDSLVLSGHEDAVTVLAWSPDGNILASSAWNWDSEDSTVRLWARDGALLNTLNESPAPVASIDWSPDGTMLATGSYDQMIRIWSSDGTLLNTIDTEKGIVFTVDWSPDGQLLASASLAGTLKNTIQIWTNEGELLHTLPTQYSGGKFLNVGWSPDGQYLAGGATDYKLWRADGTMVFAHEDCEHCTPAWGFAWSPDSTLWGIGNESGEVWVYDVDGTLIAELLNNFGNVDTMAWSPDGSMLAGGNTIWQQEGATFKIQAYLGSGRIWSLDWSPDSSMLASAGVYGEYVSLWNADGERLARLTGHTERIEKVAWSPDGALLASGSDDQTIRLWDVTAALVASTTPTAPSP